MSVAANEVLVEQRVTYTFELNAKLYVIEHVPARVNLATGEQFFAPATVERIHQIVRDGVKPARTIETPVFEFAA